MLPKCLSKKTLTLHRVIVLRLLNQLLYFSKSYIMLCFENFKFTICFFAVLFVMQALLFQWPSQKLIKVQTRFYNFKLGLITWKVM